MSLTLLVLAAGMGSRYGGLKQLEPVGPSGETILDYSVFDARRAGFERIVFVIRRDFAADFDSVVRTRLERHLAVAVVCQELADLPGGRAVPAERQKPWGTGQAVWAARNVVAGPFAVINADDFYGRDAYQQLATELRRPQDSNLPQFALVAYELGRTLSEHGSVSRGIVQAADGWLGRIDETHGLARSGEAVEAGGAAERLNPDTPVSMNLWGLTPAVFPLLEKSFGAFLDEPDAAKREFYLPGAVSSMVRDGEARVRVLRTGESWFGITYREDRPAVATAIQAQVSAGAYPTPLWS